MLTTPHITLRFTSLLRYYSISLFFILLAFGAWSQPRKDSLWKVWENTKQLDTVRLRALQLLCGQYHSSLSDSTILYTQLGYEFAKKRNLKRDMARMLMMRATTYHVKGDIGKSLYYDQQTLILNREMNYTNGIGKCYLNIAGCYKTWNDHLKAISFYYKALNIFAKTGDQECTAIAYNNLAGIYRAAGNNDSALATVKKCLALLTKTNDKGHLISALNTMGQIYYSSYKPNEAVSCHLKAAAISKDLHDPRTLATCYINVAQDYLQKSDYRLAKKYALESVELSRKLDDSVNMGHSLIMLAMAVNNMGQTREALKIGAEAMVILQRKQMLALLANHAVIMAMWYAEAQMSKKASEMYVIYYKNRNLQDNEKIKEELYKQEVKYEFEKKELLAKSLIDKKMNALKSEEERKDFKRNLWLTIAGSVLLILLLCTYFIYNNFKQKNIIAAQKNNMLKQQLLVSQMNPHFIFNSLNAVQNFIYKQDSYQAGIYLKKFSELIRMILNFSTKDLISLDDEFIFLENYLGLQKLRFNNKLSYEINIDPELEREMVHIPPMLAQPFIENAIEHGIFHKDGDGFLSIKISLQGNSLIYEIEDNGIGMEESMRLKKEIVTQHKSLAIKITKERIEAMNTQNNTDFEIEIKDRSLLKKETSGVYVKFATPYLTL